MPRKDNIHNSVKNAFIKDGWLVTAETTILTLMMWMFMQI